MTPPINIDGTNENYSSVTIDGQTVEQITIDGQDVFRTIPKSALAQDLVAWYRFEDADARDYASSSEFPDVTWGDPTAFDGTVNGATYQANGGVVDFKSGSGSGVYDFDGSDDYITTISDFSQVDTSSYTISCWFNGDSFNANGLNGILNATNFDDGMRLFIDGNDNGMEFQLEDNDTRHGAFAPLPSTNSWNHVVGRYDGNSTIDIILNNSLEGTNTSASVGNHSNSLVIGATTANVEHFDGRIDDVRIYNRALTDSEISDIYNATEP